MVAASGNTGSAPLIDSKVIRDRVSDISGWSEKGRRTLDGVNKSLGKAGTSEADHGQGQFHSIRTPAVQCETQATRLNS